MAKLRPVKLPPISTGNKVVNAVEEEEENKVE